MEGKIHCRVQRSYENTPRRVEVDRLSHPIRKECQKCEGGRDAELEGPLEPVGVCCIDELAVVEEGEGGVDAGKVCWAPACEGFGGEHLETGLPDFEAVIADKRVCDACAAAEHEEETGGNGCGWNGVEEFFAAADGDRECAGFEQEQHCADTRATSECPEQEDGSDVEIEIASGAAPGVDQDGEAEFTEDGVVVAVVKGEQSRGPGGFKVTVEETEGGKDGD